MVSLEREWRMVKFWGVGRDENGGMVEEETVGRKGKKGQTRYQTWRGCMDVDGAGGMWKCGNVGTLKGPGGENLEYGGWIGWGNITKGKHERETESRLGMKKERKKNGKIGKFGEMRGKKEKKEGMAATKSGPCQI